MKKLTAEWVRKAEADHRAAAKLHRGPEPLHDAVCFHCQQSAEKYLKGLLEELGLVIPKIHDLEKLRALLLPHHTSLRPFRRGMLFLRQFGVDIRYPGDWAAKRDAVAALRWAERVRTAARTILGVRPPRARRKR